MARPTTRPRSPVSEALIQLRQTLGDNQQQFANRTGMAITTVARYETSRIPTLRNLYEFARLAMVSGRKDLARVFSDELERQEATVEVTDSIHNSIFVALYENLGENWLESQLESLIRQAKKKKRLSYPLVFLDDAMPDQRTRLSYLEGLLISLRRRKAGSTERLLETKAAKHAEQTGKTKEQAYAEVLTPELYDKYLAEGRDAARGTEHEATMPASSHGRAKKPR